MTLIYPIHTPNSVIVRIDIRKIDWNANSLGLLACLRQWAMHERSCLSPVFDSR